MEWWRASTFYLALVVSAGWLLGCDAAGQPTENAARSQSGGSVLAVAKVHDPGTSGISLVNLATGRPTTLTYRRGWQDDDPAWSPDARSIAFTRTRNDYRSFQVFLMPAQGGTAKPLTSGRYDERPAWSPDGRWIAFQSTAGIRLIRPDGSGAHTVRGTNGAASPSWAPDGQRLAFSKGGFVWTARVDGGDRRRLLRGKEPDWSPDGERIAFTLLGGGVATAKANGQGRRLLGKGLQADWSPDAGRIAFTRWPPNLRFSVWAMTDAGGSRRLVVGGARSPDWRP